MRNLFLVLALTFLGCKDAPSPDVQPVVTAVLVSPKLTDPQYTADQESHYVVRSDKVHRDELLLFIGGSFSVPKSYSLICDHAATIGFDVISLSYPNGIAAASLASASDIMAFDNYREEICFGNAVSDAVVVDVLNSIEQRAVNIITYLKATQPMQNWDQYLIAANTLDWSRIVVAGHSQGAGHACYLAKTRSVKRVVMLSGPNDYSTYYDAPAGWLLKDGLTPLAQYFSLVHMRDEIVPYSFQVSNLRALSLLSPSGLPTWVDNLPPPYSNASQLAVDFPALSNHNSTVGANPMMPEIWTHLLTH